MTSNYDKNPAVMIASDSVGCSVGWQTILREIDRLSASRRVPVIIECYPGVFEHELIEAIHAFMPGANIFRTCDALKSSQEIEAMLSHELSNDPVFGRLTSYELESFFDPGKFAALSHAIQSSERSIVLGTGAALAVPARESRVLVYADLARWEIQRRQRRRLVTNLGSDNLETSAADKYKRAYFVDWRVADRWKQQLLPDLDFLLDTNHFGEPKMISGELFRSSLLSTVKRPFRVRPFFDPGPWGGEWMRVVCDLPPDAPNYAWCFDCVPEENSLLLGFGDQQIEVPALDLVLSHPRELMGEAVHARFGTEFPIRFDFLDTMGGGNLSLQVHPLTEYIQEHFGMPYTQDESYYLLDADADACVFLGLKDGIDRSAFIRELREGEASGRAVDVERYVNRWPARKHDHFLIPAGTIHCSGKNSMVLEISATPYIFTFKLWDWGRLGMDGRPRPIHLEHGLRNIQWDRTSNWVSHQLVNAIEETGSGAGWREERTGLHQREFIETRRHWFTGVVPHDTKGGVNVLNLVEGREAIVESPDQAFDPFRVHYAETFIVPAAVGKYTIRPAQETAHPLATVKAFVRTSA